MPAIAATSCRCEEAVEIVGRAPVRRPAREVAHDHAPARAGARLSSSSPLTP